MNAKPITLLIASVFILSNCGDNKAATTEQQVTSNSSTENKEAQSTAVAASGNEFVGKWKLSKEVFDDNGNRIPDEEEMKKAYSIQQMFTGRYEKVTENGRDMLKVYRKKMEGEEDKDPLPDIYQVTSLKKDELVLQIIEAGEPSSFWLFKRIN